MSATDFSTDLRDLRFVLFEQLKLQERYANIEKYEDFDEEMLTAILQEAEKFATGVIAPINKDADRIGCVHHPDATVTTPPGFKEAYQALSDAGWLGMAASPDFGGMGLPLPMAISIGEMYTGACMAFTIYSGLTRSAASLLATWAPEEMTELYVPKMLSGEWLGTMCLTENAAGSDVPNCRTKAVPVEGEDRTYHLEGEKIFISGGEHDLGENIIHLVLARAPGAPAGYKGISIFVVPKYMVGADGSLGARNGVQVVGIEEKMGIHGSATCTMAFGGGSTPCVGYRLGEEGEGLKIMFHMMNEARLSVGLQGLAGASAAYNNAVAYAKDRIQGRAVENLLDSSAESVAIVCHPDVRRMLMTMKVYTETMRSFLLTTATRIDIAHNTDDAEEAERLMSIVELYTPIAKAHCSDIGFEVTRIAVQVYGGYGYIGEYPVEQLLRDTKIASIYEGTNGIQALDLLGRKMRAKDGQVFMAWMQETQVDLQQARDAGLGDMADALDKGVNTLGACAMHLAGLGMQGQLKGALLQASPFLTLFGTVLLGVHALRQAVVAKAKLADNAGDKFYAGKVRNAEFYMANILPQAVALSKGIRSGDESCLDDVLFS